MFVRDRSFYTEQNEIKWNGYRFKHSTLNRRIYCVFGCFTTRVHLRYVSYYNIQACVKNGFNYFSNFALEQPIKQFFMANQQMISCKFKRRRRHHEPRKKPKTCIIWVMYLVDWTGVEINWNSDACGMTFFNEGLCDIFGNAIAVGEWEWPLLSPLQHTVTISQGRVQKDGRPKVKAQQERDWTAGQ